MFAKFNHSILTTLPHNQTWTWIVFNSNAVPYPKSMIKASMLHSIKSRPPCYKSHYIFIFRLIKEKRMEWNLLLETKTKLVEDNEHFGLKEPGTLTPLYPPPLCIIFCRYHTNKFEQGYYLCNECNGQASSTPNCCPPFRCG